MDFAYYLKEELKARNIDFSTMKDENHILAAVSGLLLAAYNDGYIDGSMAAKDMFEKHGYIE